MKKLSLILPAALLALCGCSDSELTMDKALEKVKQDANVTEVTMVEQSYNDERYHFVFEDETSRYDYVIEADGDFVSKNITALNNGSTTSSQPEGTPIPRPQPKDDASMNNGSTTSSSDLSMIPQDLLDKFNIDASGATNIRVREEFDDGHTYTDIDFSTDSARYEFVMDGQTLVEYDCDIPRSNLSGETIDMDGAINIALDFLGLTMNDVTLYDQEYDREDRQYEFEGTFANESIDFTIYENGVIHSIDYNDR